MGTTRRFRCYNLHCRQLRSQCSRRHISGLPSLILHCHLMWLLWWRVNHHRWLTRRGCVCCVLEIRSPPLRGRRGCGLWCCSCSGLRCLCGLHLRGWRRRNLYPHCVGWAYIQFTQARLHLADVIRVETRKAVLVSPEHFRRYNLNRGLVHQYNALPIDSTLAD